MGTALSRETKQNRSWLTKATSDKRVTTSRERDNAGLTVKIDEKID